MIPPPVFELAKPPTNISGEIEWRGGVLALLQDFSFDVRCDVIQYEVAYYPKENDLVSKTNNGARFNGEVAELVSRAKPGDRYTFDKFHFKCGCDETVRRRYNEPLKFTIK